METTDWDLYGTGKYEKCADCMAHCGYEPTAANASLTNPLKALKVALRGIRTEGPMAPEISLDKQRAGAIRVLRPGRADADRDAQAGSHPGRSESQGPGRSRRQADAPAA